MNFWIMTQDEKTMIKTNIVSLSKKSIYAENDILLGTYKTEDKAKEVFLVIKDFLSNANRLVFEMPKDDEEINKI